MLQLKTELNFRTFFFLNSFKGLDMAENTIFESISKKYQEHIIFLLYSMHARCPKYLAKIFLAQKIDIFY